MAQKNYTLNATFQPVASGPGNATFECKTADGEWAIISSVSPAGILGSITAKKMTPVSMALAAGEYLHLRGRGDAYVVADTVI